MARVTFTFTMQHHGVFEQTAKTRSRRLLWNLRKQTNQHRLAVSSGMTALVRMCTAVTTAANASRTTDQRHYGPSKIATQQAKHCHTDARSPAFIEVCSNSTSKNKNIGQPMQIRQTICRASAVDASMPRKHWQQKPLPFETCILQKCNVSALRQMTCRRNANDKHSLHVRDLLSFAPSLCRCTPS